jgi:hypothetical protein
LNFREAFAAMFKNSVKAYLNEEKYPGNEKAFSSLCKQVKIETIVALVGAGASIPLMPAWTGVLNNLVNLAAEKGIITPEAKHHYLAQIAKDPLQVADDLEEAFSRKPFRAKLAEMFRSQNGATTPCHDVIRGPRKIAPGPGLANQIP